MAEEPVNAFMMVTGQSNQVNNPVFTIPAGKRLVVDYMSAKAEVPAGETVSGIHINLPVVHFFLVLAQGADIFGKSVFTAAQDLRIALGPFANPRDVVVRMERNKFGTPAILGVTLAGTLVDP
jgi:hypothetical protein